MVKDHPAFAIPADPSIKTWRYMDFTKFIAMLDNNALYIARADLLGDPFEGSYSRANKKMRPLVYKDMDPKTFGKMFGTIAEFSRWIRQWTYISCWHMNERESAAMWKLYSSTNESVAIQSTYSRIRGCLPADVLIGEVRYIDFDEDWLPEGNVLFPFVYKHKSFEHERELRAVIQDLPIKRDMIDTGVGVGPPGKMVSVDLDKLVEAIYVAPAAPTWFRDLVTSVSIRYGLGRTAVRSELDKEPFF